MSWKNLAFSSTSWTLRHFMANDGETMRTVKGFILGGSQITADGDCSHKIKRHLLPGRKVMTKLDSIFFKNGRDITNKGPSSQSYGFSSSHVWIDESWTIKKAERQKIDAFELWCWRRHLDYKILKETSQS